MENEGSSSGALSATERAARNIARKRRDKDWRLEDLAQHVTQQGVPMTLNTLSKVERGVRGISVEELEAIAAAFKVPIELLLADTVRGRTVSSDAGVEAVHEAVAKYEQGGMTALEFQHLVRKGIERVAADALRDIEELASRALHGVEMRTELPPEDVERVVAALRAQEEREAEKRAEGES